MFEMLKIMFLDILGIRSAPPAPVGGYYVADPGLNAPRPMANYTCNQDRTGSFPVDRDRVY